MSSRAAAVTVNRKEPFASVVVPDRVPPILTVTPGNGVVVAESITFPSMTLFWANAGYTWAKIRAKQLNNRRIFVSITCLLDWFINAEISLFIAAADE